MCCGVFRVRSPHFSGLKIWLVQFFWSGCKVWITPTGTGTLLFVTCSSVTHQSSSHATRPAPLNAPFWMNFRRSTSSFAGWRFSFILICDEHFEQNFVQQPHGSKYPAVHGEQRYFEPSNLNGNTWLIFAGNFHHFGIKLKSKSEKPSWYRAEHCRSVWFEKALSVFLSIFRLLRESFRID